VPRVRKVLEPPAPDWLAKVELGLFSILPRLNSTIVSVHPKEQAAS
jgi:hypothetical protein